MTKHTESTTTWLNLLRAAAQARFSPERTAAIDVELRAMAEAIARILAEPLDFDDESPIDPLRERLANA